MLPSDPLHLRLLLTPEQVLGNLHAPRPLFLTRVAAGFPSPADDHIDQDLNLHAYLVRNPAGTYFARAEGDSMTGKGIHDGDLLVIDRTLEPTNGRTVVAVVNGELLVKEYRRVGRRLFLLAHNELYPPLELREGEECHIWGVVTHVIHDL
ncbi:MAG: S24 family peptidase [Bacteroidota bacterium]